VATIQVRHQGEVAAGSVLIVAIAVRMVPDGVTCQLQIAPSAQAPSIPRQVPQVVVVCRLRLRQHRRLRHRQHPAAVVACLMLIVAIAAWMAQDGVTSQLQIAPSAQVPSTPQQAPQIVMAVDHQHHRRRHRTRLQAQWLSNTAP